MALQLALWLVSILCLIPLALYLVGFLKDPFHPLIFVGALTFFVACYQPLTDLQPALRYVNVGEIFYYIMVVGGSTAALYWGYWYHRRRHRYDEPSAAPLPPVFNPSRLMGYGAALTIIGVSCYLYTRTDYEFTGYIRAWGLVWVSGVILVTQSILLKRSNLHLGLFFIAIALIPPIDRFFLYGQRGDTFRLAIIFIPAFLFFAKRPIRAFFIPSAIGLVLVLSVLQTTRGYVEKGLASNRITALIQVLPNFFTRQPTSYSGTEDFIFGSAMIDVVRTNGNYNYGRSFTDFVVRFLPKELVEKNQYYSPWSRTFATQTTSNAAGYYIYYGSFASGFAHVFVEFWWFALIFWALLGYWIRHQYISAMNTVRLDQHAYFATMFIMLLYLITQDINDFLLNMVCLNCTLWFAYRHSREPMTATEDFAAPGTIPQLENQQVATAG